MNPSVVAASSLADAPFWVWWLIPVAVTALISLAVALSRRQRRPRHRQDTVDDYTRFRDALSQVRDLPPRGEPGE